MPGPGAWGGPSGGPWRSGVGFASWYTRRQPATLSLLREAPRRPVCAAATREGSLEAASASSPGCRSDGQRRGDVAAGVGEAGRGGHWLARLLPVTPSRTVRAHAEPTSQGPRETVKPTRTSTTGRERRALGPGLTVRVSVVGSGRGEALLGRSSPSPGPGAVRGSG